MKKLPPNTLTIGKLLDKLKDMPQTMPITVNGKLIKIHQAGYVVFYEKSKEGYSDTFNFEFKND